MTKLVSTAKLRSPVTRVDLLKFGFDQSFDLVGFLPTPQTREVGEASTVDRNLVHT